MKRIIFISTLFLFGNLQFAISQHRPSEYLLGKNVKTGSAESASMTIEMLVGEMFISSDDIFHLAHIECRYDEKEWEPEINYSVTEKKGQLYLSNRGQKGKVDYDDDDNVRWDVVVKESIPVEYEVFLGAGTARLDLDGTAVKSFQFEMKAGEANIDLKNTSVPIINFKALAGEVTIDLSGEWHNDLNAHIKGGVGNLNLILPDDYAVGVEISGLIGEIDSYGFRKDGKDYYRNPGESEHTLYIEVQGGIGNVSLLLSE